MEWFAESAAQKDKVAKPAGKGCLGKMEKAPVFASKVG